MSKELLAEAIREEKSLQVCAKHARTVYYDGKECPCCQILKEYRLSWKGLATGK